ncbi:MAG TPA: PHP domain-containing protein [Dermatophilaceae bacterium]|nr:PHP domain-containing protein [Dermatophilaceae bacterium]
MLIDLHAHTTASDGTQSPHELVAEAAARGLDVLGLTDHDTTAGWAEGAAAARQNGIMLVPGIEMSCRHQGISIHLLGYLHDPRYPPLVRALAAARDSRQARAERIVAALGRDVPLTMADVRGQASPGATLGRPHIADAMVARGIVGTRDEAFRDYLSTGSPYYARYQAPEVIEAVRLITEAGGVPVMAHPFASSRGPLVSDGVIEAMADAGLAGLEAYHVDHNARQTAHALDLASSLGLFVTGSSDYHGAGKATALAAHWTDPGVLEQIEGDGRATPVVRP